MPPHAPNADSSLFSTTSDKGGAHVSGSPLNLHNLPCFTTSLFRREICTVGLDELFLSPNTQLYSGLLPRSSLRPRCCRCCRCCCCLRARRNPPARRKSDESRARARGGHVSKTIDHKCPQGGKKSKKRRA